MDLTDEVAAYMQAMFRRRLHILRKDIGPAPLQPSSLNISTYLVGECSVIADRLAHAFLHRGTVTIHPCNAMGC